MCCYLEGLRDYFCKFGEVNECMVNFQFSDLTISEFSPQIRWCGIQPPNGLAALASSLSRIRQRWRKCWHWILMNWTAKRSTRRWHFRRNSSGRWWSRPRSFTHSSVFIRNSHSHIIIQKVFIGGLSANSTLDDIKLYFAQYGKVTLTGGFLEFVNREIILKIEDAMLMFDKATQRHRGN